MTLLLLQMWKLKPSLVLVSPNVSTRKGGEGQDSSPRVQPLLLLHSHTGPLSPDLQEGFPRALALYAN